MVGRRIFIFAVLAAVLVTAVKKSYEGYKVYNVVPKTEDDVNILEDIRSDGIFAPWEEQFSLNSVAKLMVSKGNQPVFLEKMSKAGIEAIEVIADLKKVMDDQLQPATISRLTRNSETHLSMSWTQYNTIEHIYNWLDELASEYPDIVTTAELGESNEGRPIKGVIIDYRPGSADRKIGMLEGGLHAREWISPATVTWIIKEFLTSTDANVRTLAESFQWHIFPIVNPDGYSYTFTNDRMWRKNRNPSNGTCGAQVDDDMRNGIDLNRNFGYLWMETGASDDPCSNTYAGPFAFSEPESLSISNYVIGLNRDNQLIYYLAFHSFTQLVVVPYSHVAHSGDAIGSTNFADMFEIGVKAADKLQSNFGTQYRVGVSAQVMYPMAGTSFDWVKYDANVPVVYLLELRDLGEFGFLLPAEQIIPNNIEVMDFLLEMDRTTRSLGYYSSAKSVFYSVTLISFAIIFVSLFK